MQTCSKCYTQSTDTVIICPTCQADLREASLTAIALKKLMDNPRVRAIRIAVPNDACPVCQQTQGYYTKEKVPVLPLPGCSGVQGCNCTYEPVLDEIYP